MKSKGQFRLTWPVLQAIYKEIGTRGHEHGGMLGGIGGGRTITHFHYDGSADRSRASYSPDHHSLNRLLAHDWNPNGVRLRGFVHSHPPGLREPSGGDLAYAREILRANPEMPELALPIVIAEKDTGLFEVLPFLAVRRGGGVVLERRDLVVVEAVTANGSAARSAHGSEEGKSSSRPRETDPWEGETFRRVRSAYDLQRLKRSRVLAVGCGGARAFLEDLCRAGVGEFVLLDPDRVAETNLATQQVRRSEIGREKVRCLAEALRDINPAVSVAALPVPLEDLDDAELERWIREPLEPGSKSPEAVLLCGFTDRFEAQARVNRLALHFGCPSLCAQVYGEGRGAEITFTHPRTTPACHRCALSSRYRAYLEEGFRNDVTSDGTPIFSTQRLNALKGFIALALLHEGTGHPRWGGLLARIGSRNLVQIRMDPDLGFPVFDRVFGAGDRERILFDDVVWLPQKPDCPENGYPACPDCGGSGDLRNCLGTLGDTRTMRR
jgi:proteasome lid subunit RPN8/RPN11